MKNSVENAMEFLMGCLERSLGWVILILLSTHMYFRPIKRHWNYPSSLCWAIHCVIPMRRLKCQLLSWARTAKILNIITTNYWEPELTPPLQALRGCQLPGLSGLRPRVVKAIISELKSNNCSSFQLHGQLTNYMNIVWSLTVIHLPRLLAYLHTRNVRVAESPGRSSLFFPFFSNESLCPCVLWYLYMRNWKPVQVFLRLFFATAEQVILNCTQAFFFVNVWLSDDGCSHQTCVSLVLVDFKLTSYLSLPILNRHLLETSLI